MSCRKPNLQQIPRESENDWNGHLKKAFITEQGFTAYEADFSQLEFRVGCAYGKVQRLKDIFADIERDIFSEMAKDLGMSRQNTKTLNYTLQFGGGANRIKEVFGVPESTARIIINNYFKQYPGLAKASQLAKLRADQRGYVRYWTGRRRHFADKEDHRKAFNSICQGGAFEIVKRRMLALDKAGLNNPECRMDLQVHDSVRFEIEDGKEGIYLPEIKNIMERVEDDFKFGVKFKVDIKKWGEK
jgi:DNA polymerase-1